MRACRVVQVTGFQIISSVFEGSHICLLFACFISNFPVIDGFRLVDLKNLLKKFFVNSTNCTCLVSENQGGTAQYSSLRASDIGKKSIYSQLTPYNNTGSTATMGTYLVFGCLQWWSLSLSPDLHVLVGRYEHLIGRSS